MRFFKHSGSTENDNRSSNDTTDAHNVSRGFSSFWAKIVCIVAAIIVWFYVSGDKSTVYEKTFSGIKVYYTNETVLKERGGYEVLSGKDATVDVTLSGTRRDINRIKAEDIRAEIDLSSLYTSGDYPMEVKVTAPANTVVKGMNPSQVKVYVDIPTKRALDLGWKKSNVTLSDPSLSIDCEFSIDKVWITGPAEELEKISAARVDISFPDEQLSETKKILGAEIKLIDVDGKEYSNPHVTMDKTETDVTVMVYKNAVIPVKAAFLDDVDIADMNYVVSVEPKELSVRGTPEIINSIKYIETKEIDPDSISEDLSEFDINADLPYGVYLRDNDASRTIKVRMERTNVKKDVDVSNIFLVNCNDAYEYYLGDTSIEVSFSGSREYVDKLNERNICLIGDVSGITDEGSTGVKLHVVCIGSDAITSGKVNVVGEYRCAVELKEKQEEAQDVTVDITATREENTAEELKPENETTEDTSYGASDI